MQRLCTLSAWLVCAFGSMLWMHRSEAQAPLQIVPSKIDLHGFQLEHLVSVREGIERGGQSKPLGAQDGLTFSVQDPQVAELICLAEAVADLALDGQRLLVELDGAAHLPQVGVG